MARFYGLSAADLYDLEFRRFINLVSSLYAYEDSAWARVQATPEGTGNNAGGVIHVNDASSLESFLATNDIQHKTVKAKRGETK